MPRPIPLSRFLSADFARTESAAPDPTSGVTDSTADSARDPGVTESVGDAAGASGAAESAAAGAGRAEKAEGTGAVEPGPTAPVRPIDRTRTGDAAAPTPVLGALNVSAPDFGGVRYAVPDGYTAREVRGRRMRTVAGVLDEFAAALQFPYYFGGNLDAFDDSLRDLDDCLAPARGYVIAVRDADELLAAEPGQWSWFESAMTDAADYWARRGVVFRVVLQGAAPTGSAMVSLVLDTRDDD
ncbi:Barstar (barnase inhibitor) [Nocardia otitidiscaviarum]|uniref:Barstar (Barnase inhibitor) n=1 Tax=Nocardia otitidiscaviarum TaxID=1823 RepID=A0A378YJI6_9NOCA|nr:barstar family protein [Nocardia otitidiscaviarum]SUA76978.1 Barstar (barnase inhibitor) [Nocardia otitidiscaviarum]